MAEFKKYMFDDFVVEDDQEDFDDDFENKKEDLADDETKEDTNGENVVEAAPLVPPEKTFTLSEVEEKVKEAKMKAYEEGASSVRCDIEEKVSQVMETIEHELKDIFEAIDIKTRDIEKDYLLLLKESLKKIVPTVLDKDAENIVTKFVQDNFGTLKEEAKLTFYVNSELVSKVRKKIEDIAKENNFEGKVVISVDDKLLASDCRIEWESGGVERKTEKIIERIDGL